MTRPRPSGPFWVSDRGRAGTFRDFVQGPWKAACYRRCKPSTRTRMDSALNRQLLPAFGHLRLEAIMPHDVHAWFDAYSLAAPGGANRALDILRQILNHAEACGRRTTNPARGVLRNPVRARSRFLSRAEIGRLHQALDAHRGRGSGAQQVDIVRLLLLTGCRKGEIVGLRWSEVGENTLRLQEAKTGPRLVYLNDGARRILDRQRPGEGPFVFPSLSDPSKPRSLEISLWRKVRRETGIEDVRLHDLRHTFATHAVMQGTPLPVVSKLLGHSRARTTLRYAHAGDPETEAAAERVGAAVAALLSGTAGQAEEARRLAPGGGQGRLQPRANASSRLAHLPPGSGQDCHGQQSSTGAGRQLAPAPHGGTAAAGGPESGAWPQATRRCYATEAGGVPWRPDTGAARPVEKWTPLGNRMHPLIESNRVELRAIAQGHGLKRLRVFGSMARGDADERSDVDLLVDLPKGRSGLALGALLMDAQDLLGRQVEVLTEPSLHPALRQRVLNEARLL